MSRVDRWPPGHWPETAEPYRKRPDGKHQDIAHPITQEMRKYLEDKVIAEYEEEVARAKEGRMFVGSR